MSLQTTRSTSATLEDHQLSVTPLPLDQHQSILFALPEDLRDYILTMLSQIDWRNLSQTCRLLRERINGISAEFLTRVEQSLNPRIQLIFRQYLHDYDPAKENFSEVAKAYKFLMSQQSGLDRKELEPLQEIALSFQVYRPSDCLYNPYHLFSVVHETQSFLPIEENKTESVTEIFTNIFISLDLSDTFNAVQQSENALLLPGISDTIEYLSIIHTHLKECQVLNVIDLRLFRSLREKLQQTLFKMAQKSHPTEPQFSTVICTMLSISPTLNHFLSRSNPRLRGIIESLNQPGLIPSGKMNIFQAKMLKLFTDCEIYFQQILIELRDITTLTVIQCIIPILFDKLIQYNIAENCPHVVHFLGFLHTMPTPSSAEFNREKDSLYRLIDNWITTLFQHYIERTTKFFHILEKSLQDTHLPGSFSHLILNPSLFSKAFEGFKEQLRPIIPESMNYNIINILYIINLLTRKRITEIKKDQLLTLQEEEQEKLLLSSFTDHPFLVSGKQSARERFLFHHPVFTRDALLKNVRVLYLEHSDLRHLPPQVALLRNLRILSLRENIEIQVLPSWIRDLSSLEHLDVRDCPQLHCSKEVLLSTNKTIRVAGERLARQSSLIGRLWNQLSDITSDALASVRTDPCKAAVTFTAVASFMSVIISLQAATAALKFK